MVDAEHPDGPRKFPRDPFAIDNLIRRGTLTAAMAYSLEECVRARLGTLASLATGSGKCLAGDTHVMLGDGRLVKIASLVEATFAQRAVEIGRDGWVKAKGGGGAGGSSGDKIMAFSPLTVRFFPATITAFWRHPAPPRLYRVTTASGRSITVTPEHPFFTLRDGEMRSIRADELTIGLPVAIPRTLEMPEGDFGWLDDRRTRSGQALFRPDPVAEPGPEPGSWPEPGAGPGTETGTGPRTGTGPWIGTGIGTGNGTAQKTTPASARATLTATSALSHLSVLPNPHSGEFEPDFWCTFGLTMLSELPFFSPIPPTEEVMPEAVGGRDTSRARSGTKAGLGSGTIAGPSLLDPTEKKASAVLSLLTAGNPLEIGSFLRGILAGTTFSVEPETPAIRIPLPGEDWSDGLLWLFLRLGITASRHKELSGRCWVVIQGIRQLECFWQKVRPLEKTIDKQLVETILTFRRVESTNRSSGNGDGGRDRSGEGGEKFPGLSGLLRSLRMEAGLSLAETADLLGCSTERYATFEGESGQAIEQRHLEKLALFHRNRLGGRKLARILVQPLAWDPVSGIETLSDHSYRYVYDLTVEKEHNFLAGSGGFLVHNTTKLKVHSSFFPPPERIIAVDDSDGVSNLRWHAPRGTAVGGVARSRARREGSASKAPQWGDFAKRLP